MKHAEPLVFEVEFDGVVQELRSALEDVYKTIEMDPAQPQEMARRFRLNKTLTWHLSRLMRAEFSLLGMPHIPGRLAVDKVLAATRGVGASEVQVERVRAAMRRYDRVIERHVDDRTTLDLMLDGMATSPENALEASRRLAFRGASGIRGVQVQTRVLNAFIVPSAENPDRLDIAAISGYIGVRRLRPRVRCMLLTFCNWEGDTKRVSGPFWKPIFDPIDAVPFNSVLEHYGERGHADSGAEIVPTEAGMDIVLAPGQVGNQSMFDIARGDVLRAVGNRYADDGDPTGEISVSISIPSERLVFDLLYHKDLNFIRKARPLVFDFMDMDSRSEYQPDDAPSVLPLKPRVTDLGSGPLVLSTPHVPGHPMLARKVCERLGWNYEDMRGLRIELEYPPLNCQIMLRFDLPRRG